MISFLMSLKGPELWYYREVFLCLNFTALLSVLVFCGIAFSNFILYQDVEEERKKKRHLIIALVSVLFAIVSVGILVVIPGKFFFDALLKQAG